MKTYYESSKPSIHQFTKKRRSIMEDQSNENQNHRFPEIMNNRKPGSKSSAQKRIDFPSIVRSNGRATKTSNSIYPSTNNK